MLRQFVRRAGEVLLEFGGSNARQQPSQSRVSGGTRRDERATARPAHSNAHAATARSDETGTAAYGTVELLGLADITRELGTASGDIDARARAVLQDVLPRHLDRDDAFNERDTETTVISFARATGEAAKKRVRAIADEVAARLLREVPETEPVRVATRTATVGDHTGGDHGAGRSPMESAAAALDTVQAETEAITQRARRHLVADAGVIYRPVLNARHGRVAMFRSQLDDASSRTAYETIQTLSGEDEAMAALSDIDAMMLTRTVEALHGLLSNRSKALFVVPVNFHTLESKRAREAFADLCRKIPEGHSAYIAFEIYGIPKRVRSERVAELAGELRGFGKGVFVESPGKLEHLSALACSAIVGVSLNLDGAGVGKRTALAGFARMAGTLRLQILGHGAATRADAIAANDLGIKMIAGDAIAAKRETPVPPYPLNLNLTPDRAAGVPAG